MLLPKMRLKTKFAVCFSLVVLCTIFIYLTMDSKIFPNRKVSIKQEFQDVSF